MISCSLLLAACEAAGDVRTTNTDAKNVFRLAPPRSQHPSDPPAEAIPPERRVALVLELQKELKAHGYDPGSVDGLLWPETIAAIRAYQRDADLVVDGRATKELLEHLKFSRPPVHRQPSSAPQSTAPIP